MPTVFRSGEYRAHFYSHEPNEAPHVHMDGNNKRSKVWLDPVEVVDHKGCTAKDLREIAALVTDNREKCLEAWHGHFGSTGITRHAREERPVCGRTPQYAEARR